MIFVYFQFALLLVLALLLGSFVGMMIRRLWGAKVAVITAEVEQERRETERLEAMLAATTADDRAQ